MTQTKNRNILVASLLNFVKGILTGLFILVPGMSAGTLLILFGLYEVLIGKLSRLFKGKKGLVDGLVYALPIVVGVIVGIFLSSFFINIMLERIAFPMFALFAGFVFGGIPIILEEVYSFDSAKLFEPIFNKLKLERKEFKYNGKETGKFELWNLIPMIIAFVVAAILPFLNVLGVLNADSGVHSLNFVTGIMLVVSGILGAASFIIPGTSGSLVLLILGYFATVLDAISNFNFAVLGLFVFGILIGFALTIKGIKVVLKKFRRVSHMAITGFLLGSVVAIFIIPESRYSAANAVGISIGVVLFFVGTVLVMFLSNLSKFRKANLNKENHNLSVVSCQSSVNEEAVTEEHADKVEENQ